MSDIDTVTVSDIPEAARLLDVREDYEWAAGHAERALHIPWTSSRPGSTNWTPTRTSTSFAAPAAVPSAPRSGW